MRLRLIAEKAARHGIAKVTLDGAGSSFVDLYSATTLRRQTVWSSGFLSPGEHLVTIEWAGTKRLAATGTSIDLDALDVRGVLTRAVDSPVIIAWQPSHQSDPGSNGWLEYVVCGDMVDHAGADTSGVTQVKAWETLSASLGWSQRSTKLRDLYSLNPARNGAKIRVLIEIGDNVANRAMFEDPANRERIAALLARATKSVLARADF